MHRIPPTTGAAAWTQPAPGMGAVRSSPQKGTVQTALQGGGKAVRSLAMAQACGQGWSTSRDTPWETGETGLTGFKDCTKHRQEQQDFKCGLQRSEFNKVSLHND